MAEICNGLVCIGDWEMEWSSDVGGGVGVSGRSAGSGGGVYSPMGRRRPTLKSLTTSRTLVSEDEEEEPRKEDAYHRNFLESCFLCKRRLGGNCDLFMYKGEMAFCSEECREEHIEMDEAKERSLRKLALKASRKTKSVASNGVRAAAGAVVA